MKYRRVNLSAKAIQPAFESHLELFKKLFKIMGYTDNGETLDLEGNEIDKNILEFCYKAIERQIGCIDRARSGKSDKYEKIISIQSLKKKEDV